MTEIGCFFLVLSLIFHRNSSEKIRISRYSEKYLSLHRFHCAGTHCVLMLIKINDFKTLHYFQVVFAFEFWAKFSRSPKSLLNGPLLSRAIGL